MAELHEMTRAKLAINVALFLSVAAMLAAAVTFIAMGAWLLGVLALAAVVSITGMILTAPWNKGNEPKVLSR